VIESQGTFGGWVGEEMEVESVAEGGHQVSFSAEPIMGEPDRAQFRSIISYQENLINILEARVLGGKLAKLNAKISYRVYQTDAVTGSRARAEVVIEYDGELELPETSNEAE